MQFPRLNSLAVFAVFAGIALLAAPIEGAPVISEFMAQNSSTLFDEDGESSDWVEIYNPGDTSYDLSGSFLSDDPTVPTKWAFPPGTSLLPDQRLIVFASSKNRVVAGSELHTNFKLNEAGESLRFTAPDGNTVLDAFDNFPSQRSDVSYGRRAELAALVGESDSIRVLFPNDGMLGSAWKGGNEPFDDSSWIEGNAPVGYETATGNPGVLLDGARLSADFDYQFEQNVGAHTQDLDFNGQSDFWPNNPGELPSISGGLASFAGGDIYRTDFSNSIIRGNFNANEPFTIEVRLRILNSGGSEGSRGTMGIFYRDSDGSGAITYVGRDETGYLNSGNSYQTMATVDNTDGFHTFRMAKSGADIWIWRDGSLLNPGGTPLVESSVGSSGWGLYLGDTGSSNNGDWELDYLRVTPGAFSPGDAALYGGLFNLDTEGAMHGSGANPGLYIRIPFNFAEDPMTFDQLRLDVGYDDGFIAFLNGNEVARRNAPASTVFDSAAASNRPDTDALEKETLELPTGSLTPGANILSIQALNDSTEADRFLFSATLSGVKAFGSEAYFTEPTPGAANGEGILGFAGDTNFDVDRGLFDEPFGVTITSSTPGATIRFTTDGSVPSTTNGTIYTSPVPITTTTALRAIATFPDFEPSNVDTQTYLFVDDVLTQTGAGLPLPSNPAVSDWDYEMDPNVVNDPRYASSLAADLKSLPCLSVVMPVQDLWGPDGIYANPTQQGKAWERACSMEMIYPDDPGRSFQENAGMRIQGAGSRFRNLGKKSMRLAFRGEYGATKLRQPIFGTEAPDEFDTIVLRGSYFDSWTVHTSSNPAGGIGRRSALQFRDHFATETHRDMGAHAILSDWTHLYLNGIYWGIYNIHERPDEEFAELHNGGSADDYDVFKQRPRGQSNGSPPELVAGDFNAWNALMAAVSADLTVAANYNAVLQLIDVDQFIDYIILNLWGGNQDWPHNNWYAIRHRSTNGPFIFYSWDAENYLFLLGESGKLTTSVNNSPGIIYHKLRQNTDFQLLFADRVRKHLFNAGALSVEKTVPRFQAIADRLTPPTNAEGARWGDTRVEPPLNTIDDFLPVVSEKANNYLPSRNAIMIAQFRSVNLYPDVDAPDFGQHGGFVPSGYQLTISAPAGTIYYTTDGTDPISGGIPYAGTVPLNSTGTVKARAQLNGEWSALTTALFSIDTEAASSLNLVVSEFLYRPSPPSAAEVALGFDDRDHFEYLELLNTSALTIDLTGARFTRGITFVFPDETTIPADGRLILVRNQAAFVERYGTGLPVAGEYTGGLSNDGETITLLDHTDSPIQSFEFNDQAPWPTAADGSGFSLVLRNPDSLPDHGVAENWQSSSALGGSPGNSDTVPFSGAADEDSDTDSLSRLLEYTLGSSDSEFDRHPLTLRIDGEGNVVASFDRSLTTENTIIHVEFSQDLVSWGATGTYLGEFNQSNGSATVTFQAPNIMPGERHLFARLRASLLTP